MTPTEKKYANILGNLYWENLSYWDGAKNEYVEDKQLVMVSKLYRRYGESGDYYYELQILQSPPGYNMHDKRGYKNVRAKRFEDLIKPEAKWFVLAS